MTQDEGMFASSALASARDCLNTQFWTIDQPRCSREAIFMMMVVNLKDLLLALDRAERRIDFSADDVGEASGDDITKRVADLRNACCHVGSPSRFVRAGVNFSFNIVQGRMPAAFSIDGVDYGNHHADDVAIFYGAKKILMRRHALRALETASTELLVLRDQYGLWMPLI